MKVIATSVPDVLIIEPAIFGDERGFFLESFNKKKFSEAVGSAIDFVQDNHSMSRKGVLRGLHYQLYKPQGKLVRVVWGSVLDVAVDIRRSSQSFGKWVAIELTSHNQRQLWIPPGFAHGFLVLSDCAHFVYKTTEYWLPEYERTIKWDDHHLGIPWPLDGTPTISDKDALGASLLSHSIELFP